MQLLYTRYAYASRGKNEPLETVGGPIMTPSLRVSASAGRADTDYRQLRGMSCHLPRSA